MLPEILVSGFFRKPVVNGCSGIKAFRLILIGLCLLGLAGCGEQSIGMLNPKGIIAYHERKLFFDTLALMLIVVFPVIVMSFVFIYNYRASRNNQDYQPNLAHNHFIETLWWAIPCGIIFMLAIITWKKTYQLDPYNAIAGSRTTPMIVQAIALPWNWLFIYPEQGIATLNHLELPVHQQVEFWITADNSAMTALFIPQLGSQIYAMAGMRTRLHLSGNEVGVYEGMNTQYDGAGFSDMRFPTHMVTQVDFDQWVKQIKSTSNPLNEAAYQKLLTPTIGAPAQFYSSVIPNLFDNTIMLYHMTYGKYHPRDIRAGNGGN